MELLISAGMLAGSGGKQVADAAVLVRGDQIVEMGPRTAVEPLASPAANRLNCPDSTILPGLIDCHVHLAFDGLPDPATRLAELDDAGLMVNMAARARRLLDSGVTTVRDLGDRRGLVTRLRDAIANGLLPGPRILAATAPLTSTGGHCWFLGGEVEGEQAIRKMVQGNAERGADVIKVMATGGHLTPGGPSMIESQFTADELRAVVEEAHRLGLRVAAHAHGTDGITEAVAAGVDTVEHCTWLSPNGFDVPAATVAAMIERGVHVCPAISSNWRTFGERFGTDVAEQLLARLLWLDEQGVRLVAGTDAGIPGATVDDYVDALHAFRHVGFTPERILELATSAAADALGLADVGRLTAGHRADVLVVDGDPWSDLDDLRRVRLVLAGGRPHAPAAALVREV